MQGRIKKEIRIMKQVRQLHCYLGLLFGPSIIFIAFTGAFMTFDLHESRGESAYQPPVWIKILGQVHKKQSLDLPAHERHRQGERGQAPFAEPGSQQGSPAVVLPQSPPGEVAQRKPNKIRSSAALKWFFLFMSVGLIVATFTGIYMVLKYNVRRRLILAVLILGIVLPFALLYV
jgi:hypothetical protein